MPRFAPWHHSLGPGGLQRAITGYRTLVSRSAMAHHR
jgi:hypothetical protein